MKVIITIRSFLYYWRSHLGTALATAVACASLTGAFLVGDSVKATLRRRVDLKLGRVHTAVDAGERLVTEQLTTALMGALKGSRFVDVDTRTITGVLRLSAVASIPGTGETAGGVVLYGVRPQFWTLTIAGQTSFRHPQTNEAVISKSLARRLNCKPGDEIIIRVRKPTALSIEAPWWPEEETFIAQRVRVRAVAQDEELGALDLLNRPEPALNLFMDLGFVQHMVGASNRINLILMDEIQGSPGIVSAALSDAWDLKDAQAYWRILPEQGVLELRTERVFFHPAWSSLVQESEIPTMEQRQLSILFRDSLTVAGVLTYFVNEIRAGDRATPYSMVTAAQPPVINRTLRSNEILISDWLAHDLNVGPGAELTLSFFQIGPGRRLYETQAVCRVADVIPLAQSGWDPGLMPDFPGMTEAEHCRDWKTGLPIRWDRIRDVDEEYWRRFRGTPKAMVSWEFGQRYWTNQFGNLTTLRFYIRQAKNPNLSIDQRLRILQQAQARLHQALSRIIIPTTLGITVKPVRAIALASVERSVDYGSLFIGFNFFLIIASLLLAATIHQFQADQRAWEIGFYRALAFSKWLIHRLIIGEAGLVALFGVVCGVVLALGLAALIIYALNTVWSDAVAGTQLLFKYRAINLFYGAAITWLMAIFVLDLATRRYLRAPVRLLLQAGEWLNIQSVPRSAGRLTLIGWIGSWCTAVGIECWTIVQPAAAGPDTFFSSGALFLIGAILFGRFMILRTCRKRSTRQPEWFTIALRALAVQIRRTTMVIALLACGSFLIVSIGTFQLQSRGEADQRKSGTGGFDWLVQTTQPILYDLGTREGIEHYALRDSLQTNAIIVMGRVLEGQTADCLNLAGAVEPTVIGVQSERLASVEAFRFVRAMPGADPSMGWRLLQREQLQRSGIQLESDEIPAVADLDTIVWALHMRIGDSIFIRSSSGETVRLRLVGAVAHSMLQGWIFIDEREFVRLFPDIPGYRWMLIDAIGGDKESIIDDIKSALGDLGPEIISCRERLQTLNAVQNTYLNTFQVLGGFGLLIGCVGIGTVLLRSAAERRGELAMLQAIGFDRSTLRRWIAIEYGMLAAYGLGSGVVAGLLAVAPAVRARGVEVPWMMLGILLIAIGLNALLWIWLASGWVLRSRPIDVLRSLQQ